MQIWWIWENQGVINWATSFFEYFFEYIFLFFIIIIIRLSLMHKLTKAWIFRSFYKKTKLKLLSLYIYTFFLGTNCAEIVESAQY